MIIKKSYAAVKGLKARSLNPTAIYIVKGLKAGFNPGSLLYFIIIE
jgi:hypothetical protein